MLAVPAAIAVRRAGPGRLRWGRRRHRRGRDRGHQRDLQQQEGGQQRQAQHGRDGEAGGHRRRRPARRARLDQAVRAVPEPWRRRAARGRPRPERQRRGPDVHGRRPDDGRRGVHQLPGHRLPRARRISSSATSARSSGTRGSDKNQSNNFNFAQLGINPRDWIENPKNEGTEDVGGAETIHVSADVGRRGVRQGPRRPARPRRRVSACRTSSSPRS